MQFTAFLAQLDEALSSQHGPNLAYLLRPSSPHGKQVLQEVRNPTLQGMARFKGKIESPWDEIAMHYILVVNHIARDRPAEAFAAQLTLLTLFNQFFTANSGWTLPALFAISRDLRDLAESADYAINLTRPSDEKSTANMEKAATIIARAVNNCISDRTSPPDESRKWGIYYIVGLVLKCYFRINRINLSKPILRALEAFTDLPAISQYPRGHQVTYRYYVGMIAFLNEEYAKAENEFTLALYHCLSGSRNQERILTFLTPLRLLRGHLPSPGLLARFPALDNLYSPFVAAIQKGDLRSYDETLQKWESRLSDINLFFTLERARELCMRSLFRRAWIVSEKSSRMTITTLHAALKVSGIEVEVEEAECFVANMIYKGFMKGYISHEQQTVVLSKNNAFPRLADRQAPFAFLF